MPQSTKFLDTQGILPIADSFRYVTAGIKYNNQQLRIQSDVRLRKKNTTTNSSYHHPGREEIIMSKERGDKKRVKVGVYVLVKGEVMSFLARSLARTESSGGLFGLLGPMESLKPRSILQEWELPSNVKVLFSWWLGMTEASSLRLQAMMMRLHG
jgi:hypothetical protein